jgi:hypothetical protein
MRKMLALAAVVVAGGTLLATSGSALAVSGPPLCEIWGCPDPPDPVVTVLGLVQPVWAEYYYVQQQEVNTLNSADATADAKLADEGDGVDDQTHAENCQIEDEAEQAGAATATGTSKAAAGQPLPCLQSTLACEKVMNRTGCADNDHRTYYRNYGEFKSGVPYTGNFNHKDFNEMYWDKCYIGNQCGGEIFLENKKGDFIGGTDKWSYGGNGLHVSQSYYPHVAARAFCEDISDNPDNPFQSPTSGKGYCDYIYG